MKTKSIFVNLKKWIKSNLRLKVSEIALSGIFIALWLVSRRFLSINLGIMTIGITYVWMILISLTTRPILGIFTLLIGDTLSLLITGSIARWMLIYAVIPLIIYLITYCFKKFIFNSKEKTWWITILLSTAIIFLTTFFVSLLNQDFVKRPKFNPDIDIDFSSFVSEITIWTVFAVMAFSQIVLLIIYYLKRNKKIKLFLSVYSLVSLTIVITIWLIGPIANILYLNRFSDKNTNYWNSYNIFLIARILKTIVILPFYTIVIFPIYQVSKIIFKTENATKW